MADQCMTGNDRFLALDGLRAVAIMLVLSAHMYGLPGAFQYPSWWWHLGDWGNLGVMLFFVISGFIITHLLLREFQKEGRISIRNFYIRRAFRILPPLAIMLVFAAAGRAAGWWQIPAKQFLTSLFFLGNVSVDGSTWTLGHLWSLAVEEQFYIIWPAALVFGLSHPRFFKGFVLSILLVSPLMRCLGPNRGQHDPVGFLENADALAMGALGALVMVGRMFHSIRPWLSQIPSSSLMLGILILNMEPVPLIIKVAILYPAIHLFTLLLIIRIVERDSDLGARILSSRLCVFIGGISYSLYLFQQPFFNRPYPETFPTFPVTLLPLIAIVVLCFYFIELPSRKWRDRVLSRCKHE